MVILLLHVCVGICHDIEFRTGLSLLCRFLSFVVRADSLLGLLPERLHLRERALVERHTAVRRCGLHGGKASDEFFARGMGRLLGIDTRKARHLHGGEQQVAQFLGHGVRVAGVAPVVIGCGNAARRVLVRKNIFTAMHKAAETPSQANGFPKLVSSASEKIKHPYITDNLFFDIDTAEPYSWWNTMVAEDIEAAGQVLAETPFEADPATGKFTVKAAYKGYGDTRW